MPEFFGGLICIVCVILLYMTGCFHIDTREESIKKESQAQMDALTYCHLYCEKLHSNTFYYGPGIGCACQFKVKGK